MQLMPPHFALRLFWVLFKCCILHLAVSETIHQETLSTYDRFYVVNLERSTSRRSTISRFLEESGVEYSIFPAVDGLTLTIEDLTTGMIFTGMDIKSRTVKISPETKYKVYCTKDGNEENTMIIEGRFRILNAGEFGLWCSHKLIWKDIIANQYQETVIVDDDFVPVEDFKSKLDGFLNAIPNNFDLAYLGFTDVVQGSSVRYNTEMDFAYQLLQDALWAGSWGLVLSHHAASKLDAVELYFLALDDFYNACVFERTFPMVLKDPLVAYVSRIALLGVDTSLLTENSEISKMGPREFVSEESDA